MLVDPEVCRAPGGGILEDFCRGVLCACIYCCLDLRWIGVNGVMRLFILVWREACHRTYELRNLVDVDMLPECLCRVGGNLVWGTMWLAVGICLWNAGRGFVGLNDWLLVIRLSLGCKLRLGARILEFLLHR